MKITWWCREFRVYKSPLVHTFMQQCDSINRIDGSCTSSSYSEMNDLLFLSISSYRRIILSFAHMIRIYLLLTNALAFFHSLLKTGGKTWDVRGSSQSSSSERRGSNFEISRDGSWNWRDTTTYSASVSISGSVQMFRSITRFGIIYKI